MCMRERESTEYFGFSLDADFESRETSGEYASEALPLEGIEKVKPRRGQAEKPPPFLHHSYARMIYARATHCVASPHGFSLSAYLSSSSLSIYFFSVFIFSSVRQEKRYVSLRKSWLCSFIGKIAGVPIETFKIANIFIKIWEYSIFLLSHINFTSFLIFSFIYLNS